DRLIARPSHRAFDACQLATLDSALLSSASSSQSRRARPAGVAPWRIVPEAKARGTAPAVAAAAELLHREDPDALLLVLPADHLIRDVVAFRHAVETGHRAGRGGALVDFGVPARSPQTGFGYVYRGATWPGIPLS